MLLTIYHAERRCEPCREMHGRIDQAIDQFTESTGLDVSGAVEFIDIDENPELTPSALSVVPMIVARGDKGTYFTSHGRCTIEAILGAFELIASKVDLPAASENSGKKAKGTWSLKQFSPDAPSADVVFYRTYSRRNGDGTREDYGQMVNRVVDGIAELGQLGAEDDALVRTMAEQQHTLPSGRWLWVGGTKWISKNQNFSGAYNCTNTTVNSPEAFGLMMELAMMGSGTGAILETDQIAKLPKIYRKLNLLEVTPVGRRSKGGHDKTFINWSGNEMIVQVGDSRKGWVDAYQVLIDSAMSKGPDLDVIIDLGQVRKSGSPLKGFGGTANPIKLPELFTKVCALLNKANGRKLTSIECCLLIDEAAACIVAGNIRRSAGMRQFSSTDKEAATAKLGLYSQDEEGNWRVDPAKENLRMANHTRCFHSKPTLKEVTEAVTLQVESGEGAIMYVPEAIARSNVDLLNSHQLKMDFIEIYVQGGRSDAMEFLSELAPNEDQRALDHRMMRYGLNPCGEILGEDFHCNLAEIHLNTLDPLDHAQQADAFRAGALEVAALLFHQFKDERYQYSREIDPIVGVSFTGLFDFFVNAFGADWLAYMFAGRPADWGTYYESLEAGYLSFWRQEVEITVAEFCEARGLKAPNRCTTVQPAGTKSLLTGASSGWHPPKAQRFIRRVTFGAHDPVALAAIEAGYSVVPAPSARDDEGNLLSDINDPRAAEWLVEIPTAVSWANRPGCDQFDLSKLSAAAQFGLWMNVQRIYTAHNTSATIELRPDEIGELSALIHESMLTDSGYISAALLQRFDVSGGTFPLLPFEPIDKATYERLSTEVDQRKKSDFTSALARLDDNRDLAPQESACSSAACLANAEKAERDGKAET